MFYLLTYLLTYSARWVENSVRSNHAALCPATNTSFSAFTGVVGAAGRSVENLTLGLYIRTYLFNSSFQPQIIHRRIIYKVIKYQLVNNVA